MKSHVEFTESEIVKALYMEFKVHGDNLYHYTSVEKLESIQKGKELWITRSDSFLDDEEIKYGLDLLEVAAKVTLSNDDVIHFNKLLAGFGEFLKDSYIFSTTYNSSSDYLLKEYGRNIIEFSCDFSVSMSHISYHSIKNSDGYNFHYFDDLYECVEGYVIYDRNSQRKIAEMAVKAMCKVTQQNGNIVDILHVRKILLMCISLFKRESYHLEEEYRIVLIRKNSPDNLDFNYQREDKGKYIKAVIPELHQRLITDIFTK
jgi:hypothetical protein